MPEEYNRARMLPAAAVLILFFGYSGRQLGGGGGCDQFFISFIWAYILLADYAVSRSDGACLAVSRPVELLVLAGVSLVTVSGLQLAVHTSGGWRYVNCPGSLPVRWAGLALGWAAALPAFFITAELLRSLRLFRGLTSPRFTASPVLLILVFIGGIVLACCAALYAPLRPLGAVSLLLLAEPLNCRFGLPSLLRDLSWGLPGKAVTLAAAGLICGLAWGAGNSLSGVRLEYTGPFAGGGLFGLPLLAYAGFALFSPAAYALNNLLSVFRGGRTWEKGVWALRGQVPLERLKWGVLISGALLVYYALSAAGRW